MGYIAPIHEVTRILKTLLENKMEMNGIMISNSPLDLVPDQNVKRINLFLYEVKETPNFRNQPTSNLPITQPPISLNLNYLLTPFPDTTNYDKDFDLMTQEILSDAMRVFHDNPTIENLTNIQNQIEKVTIILSSVDKKELIEIWKGFKVPYRLSVVYTVAVVFKSNHLE